MKDEIPKYVKQKNCNCCGHKHAIIAPTGKNLRDNPFLTDSTEVMICRNPGCKLFQRFAPDGWWEYRRID